MKLTWHEFKPDTSLANDMPSPLYLPFDRAFDGSRIVCGEPAQEIALLSDKKSFSINNNVTVENLEVKKPGTTLHRFPSQYAQWSEFVESSAAHQMAFGQAIEDKTGVLTIRQAFLLAGNFQTNRSTRSWHLDFLDTYDGKRQRPMVDHIYMAVDESPVRLQKCLLDNALEQLNEDEDIGSYQAKPHQVNFATNFTWHTTVPAPYDCVRTFVRLAYLGPS